MLLALAKRAAHGNWVQARIATVLARYSDEREATRCASYRWTATRWPTAVIVRAMLASLAVLYDFVQLALLLCSGCKEPARDAAFVSASPRRGDLVYRKTDTDHSMARWS